MKVWFIQLPSSKSFRLCIPINECISSWFIHYHHADLVSNRNYRLFVSNLYPEGRNCKKSTRITWSENYSRPRILRLICFHRHLHSFVFMDVYQRNHAVWWRFSQCDILCGDIGLDSSLLHGDMVVDFDLRCEHETIFNESDNSRKRLPFFRLVDCDYIYSNWHYKFICARRWVSHTISVQFLLTTSNILF